ncbi:MAG: antitoxin [Deltaproteobacteria bacterium]
MRTTVTLDPDVERLIAEAVHRDRKSFKEVVNEAIRRALAPGAPSRGRSRFDVVSHRTALVPGIDHARLNALADQLDDESTVSPARPVRRAR